MWIVGLALWAGLFLYADVASLTRPPGTLSRRERIRLEKVTASVASVAPSAIDPFPEGSSSNRMTALERLHRADLTASMRRYKRCVSARFPRTPTPSRAPDPE
jgi:hypothetical protein